MKKLLDLHTFGYSPAEVTLAIILNDIGDHKVSKKVSTLLGRYSTKLKFLATQVTDLNTRRWLSSILKQDIYKKIESWPEFKNEEQMKEILTYVKNCLAKRFRIFEGRNKA